jgi:hypothetical protein
MKTLFAKGSLLATTLLVCGATGEVAAQQSSALVIQGGTLVDGNGGPPLANAVIVIQGNRRARGFINLQGGGPDGKRLSAPEWGAVSNEAYVLVPFAFTSRWSHNKDVGEFQK